LRGIMRESDWEPVTTPGFLLASLGMGLLFVMALRAYTKTNYAIFIYAASANSTGSHNRLSIKRIDAT
jgi:hypothetical protein